jgi:beta-lactamase regulating signal transducer with metallopeptidase domain
VNMFSDVISFSVSLAINLFLVGLMVAGSTATAFRFIRSSSPRLRYVIAVVAFAVAAFGPLVVTSRQTFKPPSSTLSVVNAENRKLEVTTSNSLDDKAELAANRSAADQTRLLPKPDLLTDFAFYVSRSWLGWLFSGLWLLASAWLLLREFAAHCELKKERKEWQVANAEQRRKVFCPDNITLYFAECGSLTSGFFSPAIVLPRQFPSLFESTIRGIMLHEIAHAKWRDPLVNCVLRVLRALFWVSPVLWFLEHLIRVEREAAADRAALKSLSNSVGAGTANTDYATTIVSIAKVSTSGLARRQRSLAVIHFGGASNLEKRIHRILYPRSQPAMFSVCLGCAVFLTSLLALTMIPVASIPLMRNQAELSQNIFRGTGESSSADLIRHDSRSSLQENGNGDRSIRKNGRQATAKSVNGNSKSRKPEDETKEDAGREIFSPASIAEQKDNNELAKKIETSNPAKGVSNSQMKFDYRGDSGKSNMRIVTKPVVRVVF